MPETKKKKSWFKKAREALSPFSRMKQAPAKAAKPKKKRMKKRKPIDYAKRVKERPPH